MKRDLPTKKSLKRVWGPKEDGELLTNATTY